MATSGATTAAAMEPGRAAAFPLISEEAWWRLRKQFIDKPPRVVDEEYVMNILNFATASSAKNLLRPLKRIGLVGDDGKPTDLAFRWREDDEYPAVCQEILEAVYPDSLRDAFSGPEVDRSRVEGWFSRTQRVGTSAARQYAAFYMLMLEADPSKQEDALALKGGKAQKTSRPLSSQSGGAQPRPRKAKSESAASGAQQSSTTATQQPTDTEHDSEPHHATPRRPFRGIEPSLNINVEIHIPAEATPDQIDQIFESMAKHLYKRQHGADE